MARLAEIQADGFAAMDEVADDLSNAYRNRLSDILLNPKQRNPEIWKSVNVPVDADWVRLNETTNSDRSLEWFNQRAAVFTAAEHQAYVEILCREFLTAANRQTEKTRRAVGGMERAQIVAEAKQGIRRADYQEARRRRQEKRQNGQTVNGQE